MDLVSLAVGAIVALALAVIIYTQRHRINALRGTVTEQATATRARLTRSAETAYREAVVNTANRLHVVGHRVPLERVAVEPYFVAEAAAFNPLEPEDPSYDRPHHLVPFIPDWPQLAGPYHLPGIPLSHLLRGSPGLALLGLPGSGRTVALALMALRVAQQSEAGEDTAGQSLFGEKRLPVYVHVADVNLVPGEPEEQVDPMNRLLDAARSNLRGLAGRLLAAAHTEFANGRGLILVDGWDEVDKQQQARALDWLDALMHTYPGNKIVVAGPVKGYAPLQALGLAPVYIGPWSDSEHAELAERWAAAWPEIGGMPKAPATPPTDDLVRRATRGNRAHLPLDVTLHIWATYAGDDPGEGRPGWYAAYINRAAPESALIPGLERAAAQLFDTETPGLTLDQLTTEVDAAARVAVEQPAVSTPDFIYAVTRESRLLTEHTSGQLIATHPTVGAYLAARGLHHMDDLSPDYLTDNRFSRLVMPFLAALRDVTPLVESKLNSGATILHDDLLEMALWAADADPEAGWRAQVFTRLSQMLLQPIQYPAMRERALAALVSSRDPNVVFVFREGLKSTDPDLRRLAVLGLGALGSAEIVVALGEHIEDPEGTVEVATTLALGAIGAQAALNYLIQVLLTGSDLARRGAAEMLATTNLGGEGHDVLREAADEADPATRRAAVYGLARVGAPWAVELINNAERHDDQWVVRAAAGSFMDRYREGGIDVKLPTRPLRPEETTWLVQWLAARNQSAAPGAQGMGQLVRALQEGDEAIRLAAVEALGRLGAADGIKALYGTLRDEHPEIRDAAYRSLGSISQAAGQPLPGLL